MPAGQWIVGGGWNEMLWGGEVPTAAWLDEAAPANPVYLTRMDGHSAVVNSAALRAGGVDDATPDPDQGRIIRDAAGAATGVLACALTDLLAPELLIHVRTLVVSLSTEICDHKT